MFKLSLFLALMLLVCVRAFRIVFVVLASVRYVLDKMMMMMMMTVPSVSLLDTHHADYYQFFGGLHLTQGSTRDLPVPTHQLFFFVILQ